MSTVDHFEASDPGTFALAKFSLLGLYGPLPGWVLSYLIGQYRYQKADENGGWFVCSSKYMNKAFHDHLSQDRQQRALAFLQRCRIVRVRKNRDSLREVFLDRVEFNRQMSRYLKLYPGLSKRGVDAETHPGVDAETHPGVDAETHPGVDAETHPGVDAETHPKVQVRNKKERCNHLSDAPLRGGVHVSLGLEGEEKEHTPSFAEECTLRLIKALKLHRKEMRRPNLSAWVKEFTALEREIGKDKLLPLLKWYYAHMGEAYVPQAYSPRAIGEKLPKIQAAMERNRPPPPPEEVELDEDGQWVWDHVSHLNWPKGSKTQVPALIAKSVVNLRRWNRLVNRYQAQHNPDSSLCRFLHAAETVVWSPRPKQFLLEWFTKLFEKYSRWDTWSGRFANDEWHLYHTDFQTTCRTFATERGEDLHAWDLYCGKLAGLLNEHENRNS